MTSWGKKIIALAGVAVLIIALTACGNDNKQESTAEQEKVIESPDSSQPEAEQQTNADEADSETRVVKDEFGEVTIPVQPQRVAGIYVEDYMVALGITPVVQWYNPNWGKQDYLNLDVPLFDNTGSVEALLAQDPDLVIVDGGVDLARYEQYAKVAPTYRLPESVLQSSEETLKVVADLLGVPEKAESTLAAYEAAIADAKVKLEQAVGKETVAFIRVNTGDKTIALFGIKNRYVGEVLYDKMNLEPHPLVKNMEEYQQILSEESFALLDADHIVVIPSDGDWSSAENQESFGLLDSPLWNNVPAFVNGHVYKADRSHWQSGGITANLMKIEDLVEFMAK